MSTLYTVDIKRVEQSEELCMEIPDELMEAMGWEIGDDLKFIDHKDGTFGLRKVTYETIELDFDDEELFKYMRIAHEKDMSFNRFIETVLTEVVDTIEGNRALSGSGYPTGNDADFGESME
jgi:bifunctional DNA-binding transcriptional regulator/antitoxin component of YhaV-PrlF toxin-antitoxin module